VMMSVLVSGIDQLCNKRGMSTSSSTPSFSPTGRPYCQSEIHFLVPINVRPLFSCLSASNLSLGNFFAVLLIPFKLHFSDPRQRLLAVTKKMNEIKSSPQPLMMFIAVFLIVRFLPLPLARFCIDSYNDLSTAIITNNRSPDSPLYFHQRQLLYWVSWAPSRSSVGLSQTILTYNQQMRVSFVIDQSIGISGAELIETYEKHFRQLEATVPANHQPIELN